MADINYGHVQGISHTFQSMAKGMPCLSCCPMATWFLLIIHTWIDRSGGNEWCKIGFGHGKR
jgi:hypothetical protein